VTDLLDRDWAATFGDRFAGRLTSATFVREVVTGYNSNDPSGPPQKTTTTYACDGLAWRYIERYVDGEKVHKGDYVVTILRSTVKNASSQALTPSIVPQPGDAISIPPPGESSTKNGRVLRVKAVTAAYATVVVSGDAL